MPQLERQPVRILTDTGASPIESEVNKLGIEVLPLHIKFPDGDDILSNSITPDEFYRLLEEKNLPPTPENPKGTKVYNIPTTSAVNEYEFSRGYQKLADEGATTIFSIQMTAEPSVTYNNAVLAADRFMESNKGVDIRPINTKTMSRAEMFIVTKAAEMAQSGKTPEDIQTTIDYMIPRVGLTAVFKNLEYFKRGGRAAQAKGFLLSMLSIQPILGFDKKGSITMLERRSKVSQAQERQFEMLLEHSDLKQIDIIHANDLALAQQIKANLATHFAGAIGIFEIGPMLAVHGGPGVLGFCWESETIPINR